MREFLALQKRIFPVYFGCQIGLAVLTAATHPPYGIISLVKDVWSVVPLGIVLGMGAVNYFVYGPKTMTASFVRRAAQGMCFRLFVFSSFLSSFLSVMLFVLGRLMKWAGCVLFFGLILVNVM